MAKSDLLRLVVSGDDIVPDPQARLPGRGAYLHLSQECWEQAQRRRVFPRALRKPGPLGTDRVGNYLAGLCADAPAGPGRAGVPGTGAETATAGKRDPIAMSAR